MTALVVFERKDLTISATPEITAQIETALSESALVGLVVDAETNETADRALKTVNGLLSQIEAARKKVKEPILELGRSIDAEAKRLSSELTNEKARLGKASADWQTEQLERVRAQERARQAELDRIRREQEEKEAEIRREEQRKIDEANRKAREEAEALRKAQEAEEAERRRVAAEAKAKADAEAAAARNAKEREEAERRRIIAEAKAKADAEAAKERARIAAEEAEKRRQENEARIKAEAEDASKRAAELSCQDVQTLAPAPVLHKAKGQSVKEDWEFEVTNVFDLLRARPDLVNPIPRTAEIKQAIDMLAVSGEPKIAGLRIFRQVKVSTRQTKGATVDV